MVFYEIFKKKIIKLRKKIFYHAYLYHTLNSPVISDEQYDYLMTQLQMLEKRNDLSINIISPIEKVGSKIPSDCKSFFHLTPMLSLDNVFNVHDYLKFEKKIKNILNINDSIELCCELKIDGLALNLIYEKGKLIKAATRGDGKIGEDVTNNAMIIKSIPLNLNGSDIPDLMEIRGEVFIKNSDFVELNKEAMIKKEKIFSNPRNAAAGSLRHNKKEIILQRRLMFYGYSFNIIKGQDIIRNHYDKLKKLKYWGLPIESHTVLCTNIKEVLEYYTSIEKKRSRLNFNIDGIVIKINLIKFQKKLGNCSKFPRWAIAFKFQSVEKITKVLSVDFQVGRTGILTPVARLEPIKISGVVICNVSLYSNNEINRIGLSIGDYVSVCRSGDVIPKIINVIKLNTNIKNNKIVFPVTCPICMYKIIQKKKDGNFYCSGAFNCIAQRKKVLFHFFSKKALNVKGLGLQLISKLVDFNYVRNPLDFFKLDIKELIKLDNIGIRSARSFLISLNRARSVVLSKLIYAFGIYEVGSVTSMLLSNHFNNLNNLMSATRSDLLKIQGLGPIVSKNIFKFFHDQNNLKWIFDLLKQLKVYPDITNKRELNNNKFLFDKKIVITGVFDGISRNQLIQKIEFLGGKVVNSISKKVDFLISGKNSGMKLMRAKKLEIPIIYDIDFLFN